MSNLPTAPAADSELSGEQYQPYVDANQEVAEFTATAVLLGTLQAIIFGVADAYLALKLGMTVGASIPAAVISMAVLRGLLKRGSVLENNLVQNMASVGESLACGAAFTIPALFLLQGKLAEQGQPTPFLLNNFSIYFLIAMGGLMGILFMIPMRRYLIVKEHGKLRYPEGTACAEVLIAGDKGGESATNVFLGIGVAGLYRFLMGGCGLFKEVVVWPVKTLKTAFSFDLLPSLLAVGYILGLETCFIMFSGAFLGWFVIIPLISYFGESLTVPLAPATEIISKLEPELIAKHYVRYIGAGAVTFGGLLSLAKALPTIIDSIRLALFELTSGSSNNASKKRTAKDIPLHFVLASWVAIFLIVAFNTSVNPSGFLGAFLTVVFAFFFVTVSSRIVGLVGTTSMPLSGMTISALLITCAVVKWNGYLGGLGMSAALVVASMVCIAISMGGDISQDLKIGFLVGATPKWVQTTQILSVLTSAFGVCATIQLLMPQVASGKLPAPQPNLLLLITQGVIDGTLPWVPVLIGMCLGLAIEMLGIPALPFAIGLYLPFELSSTLLFGGLIHYLYERATPEKFRKLLYEDGLLLCSGMVAGDALVGVGLAALMAYGKDTMISDQLKDIPLTQNQLFAFLTFAALCLFLARQLSQKRKQLLLDSPVLSAEPKPSLGLSKSESTQVQDS